MGCNLVAGIPRQILRWACIFGDYFVCGTSGHAVYFLLDVLKAVLGLRNMSVCRPFFGGLVDTLSGTLDDNHCICPGHSMVAEYLLGTFVGRQCGHSNYFDRVLLLILVEVAVLLLLFDKLF